VLPNFFYRLVTALCVVRSSGHGGSQSLRFFMPFYRISCNKFCVQRASAILNLVTSNRVNWPVRSWLTLGTRNRWSVWNFYGTCEVSRGHITEFYLTAGQYVLRRGQDSSKKSIRFPYFVHPRRECYSASRNIEKHRRREISIGDQRRRMILCSSRIFG